MLCFLCKSEGTVVDRLDRNFYDADRYALYLQRVEEEIAWQLKNTIGYLEVRQCV